MIGKSAADAARKAVMPVLVAISLSHMINDTLQSLIPAIYPMVKSSFRLNYTQVGLITFVYQITASLLQPLVGAFTDRKPMPYVLVFGMGMTASGLFLLSFAINYPIVLLSVAMVGTGSSVFHPESSRIAHMAAGDSKGFAQSFFQVGGNAGTSLGPLLAALVIVNMGRTSIAWFCILALAGIMVMLRIGKWYSKRLSEDHGHRKPAKTPAVSLVPGKKVIFSLLILVILIFSKYFYLASLNSFYMFYLIEKFGITVRNAQFYLFIFQAAVAAGTLAGGPIGDRIGRKYVIWASILGAAPFTLALPYAGLAGTIVLTVFIGLVLSSAFSAILVYAHELIPGKVGLVSGLFFGLAFGMAGIGSAVLGLLADRNGIYFVYHVCAFLPLLGLLAALLPGDKKGKADDEEETMV